MRLREYEEFILENFEKKIEIENFINENMPFIEFDKEELSYAGNVEIKHIERSTLEYLEEISKLPYLEEDLSDYETIDTETLISMNLRLVSFLGMKLLKEGIDFMDLVQEGTIALIEGIEKFKNSPYIDLKKFLEVEILKRMIFNINESLESKKSEILCFFQGKAEEFENNDEVLEELKKKITEIKNKNYHELENTLFPLEVEVINSYYGLDRKKSFSIFEIEKELELEKEKGEEIFQSGINKLSRFGSELFRI